MPIPVITQNPEPFWSFEFVFPTLLDADNLSINLGAGGFNRYHMSKGMGRRSGSQMDDFPGGVQAAGGGVCNVGGDQQVFCRSRADGGAGDQITIPMSVCRCYLDTGNAAALAAGATMVPRERYWWLQVLVRLEGGTPIQNTGLIIRPTNNRNNFPWPGNAVGATNTGGFGFVGNGAGQWQYASYNRAGINLLYEAIPCPAHVITDWNLFEIAIVNARPGIPATIEAYFNGVLVANRGWASGLLEDYAGGGSNEWSYVPVLRSSFPDVMDWKQLIVRKGPFTRLGAPL